MWDILTNDEKNKIVLKILVAISKLDGHIHENEFSYLVYFCKNANLDPNIISTMANDTQELNEILPSNEQDRMNILYHALFAMNADHLVDIAEEQKVYSLAFKLGFSENMTRDFIDLMKSHTLDKIPMNAMMDIIRKYNS